MSIPSNHPMNMGYELKPLLQSADCHPRHRYRRALVASDRQGARRGQSHHIAPDPLHGYVPVRGHPCDIALACAQRGIAGIERNDG